MLGKGLVQFHHTHDVLHRASFPAILHLPALCFLCRMDVSRQVGGQTPARPPSWELREKQLDSVWPRTLSGENQARKIKVLLLGYRTVCPWDSVFLPVIYVISLIFYFGNAGIITWGLRREFPRGGCLGLLTPARAGLGRELSQCVRTRAEPGDGAACGAEAVCGGTRAGLGCPDCWLHCSSSRPGAEGT